MKSIRSETLASAAGRARASLISRSIDVAAASACAEPPVVAAKSGATASICTNDRRVAPRGIAVPWIFGNTAARRRPAMRRKPAALFRRMRRDQRLAHALEPRAEPVAADALRGDAGAFQHDVQFTGKLFRLVEPGGAA